MADIWELRSEVAGHCGELNGLFRVAAETLCRFRVTLSLRVSERAASERHIRKESVAWGRRNKLPSIVC